MDDTVSGASATIRKIAEEELPSWCRLRSVELLAPSLEHAHTAFTIQVEITDLDPHDRDDWAHRLTERVRTLWPPEAFLFSIRIAVSPEEGA